MPLGTALGLFRLVGAECNINALADLLKLGNLGAGIFQFGIIAVLCVLRSAYSCSHSAIGKVFVPFGRFAWR